MGQTTPTSIPYDSQHNNSQTVNGDIRIFDLKADGLLLVSKITKITTKLLSIVVEKKVVKLDYGYHTLVWVTFECSNFFNELSWRMIFLIEFVKTKIFSRVKI